MESKGTKHCSKCGTINDLSATFCSHCGSKFEEEHKESKKKSKRKTIIIVGIVLLACVFGIKTTLEIIYYDNCVDVAIAMFTGLQESEETCNEIVSIWNNSIFEIDDSKTDYYTKNGKGYFFDDFNEALEKYTTGNKYADHIRIIMKNQTEVNEIIDKVRHGYGGKYQYIGDEILEIYDNYIEFTNMPIYINGSLNSFSNNFKELDEEIGRQVQRVVAYFE